MTGVSSIGAKKVSVDKKLPGMTIYSKNLFSSWTDDPGFKETAYFPKSQKQAGTKREKSLYGRQKAQ